MVPLPPPRTAVSLVGQGDDQLAALQEGRAQVGREGGGDAVDRGAGLGGRGDLGQEIVGADRGGDPGGLIAAAEAGQARARYVAEPWVLASSSRASAAGGSRRLAARRGAARPASGSRRGGGAGRRPGPA